MSSPGLPIDRFPSRCYAERMVGDAPPLARAVAAVLSAIPAVLGTRPISWYVGREGTKPFRIGTDESVISALLADTIGRQDDVVPFSVADDPIEWNLFVAVHSNPLDQLEYVDASLPTAREAQLVGLGGMMDLVAVVATGFGAHTAYIEDSALQNLYVGRRVIELIRAKVPPALRDRVGEYHPVAGAAGGLPELLLPSEFDRALVPHALYWVNHWSARQIDTVGRERVESAPWERMAVGVDGALTLAATAAPPDLTSVADLERLRRIIEHLGLREAQERAVHAGERADKWRVTEADNRPRED